MTKKEIEIPVSNQHEAWRSVPSFAPNCVLASTAGRVWLRHKGIVMPTVNKGGYFAVHLFSGLLKINKIVPVHRLVCEAFHRKPESDKYNDVAHLDGNPFNNCVSNLAWATASENRMHTEVHKAQRGDTGQKVLTPHFLALVRHVMQAEGLTVEQVAELTSLDAKNLSNVLGQRGNSPSAIRRQLAEEKLKKSLARAKRIETVTRQQAAAAESECADARPA